MKLYKSMGISSQILLIACTLSVVLVAFLLSFSANQVVHSKNAIKEIVNKDRSFAVIEKVDRNFYERFGDVQAFAYNRLAIEALDSSRATMHVQQFLNTMVSYYVLYDLMMVVNKEGNIVAVNTKDKNSIPIQSQSLVGRNVSGEQWFQRCMDKKGPEGGAWYSDFAENPLVAEVYRTKGRGMAFASPIRNDSNAVVGVWYNFASWKDVTQDIRQETELSLQKESADAFIVITNKDGLVIDASDESLILTRTIQLSNNKNDFEFKFGNRTITSEDYIVGSAIGRGAYTYKGNNWVALTFMPRDKISLSIFFGELLSFTIVIVVILILGIAAFFLLSVNISNRINVLQKVINAVSTGELPEIETTSRKDEIGDMTNSIGLVISGLRRTSLFANEIGNGNLDMSFEPLSEKDILGYSLISMSKNLSQIKANEEKRKWVTEGVALFGGKLRITRDVSQLCNEILLFLSRYVHSNQGAIFLAEGDAGNIFLSMKACYAWNRKKYLTREVQPGEGLIGQAWQEGEMIYLTSVPDGFIKITSGLGESNPDTVIILPLKHNAEVLGVIEMAFFHSLQEHEIEFLKKVSDAMASTLHAAKINAQTEQLLVQAQEQSVTMKSQEEEMRQNMEELTAIQEEMTRKEKEYIERIRILEGQSRVYGNGRSVAQENVL